MDWKKKFLRLKTILLVVTYIGFVLYLICFVTPAWIGFFSDVYKVTSGLFMECRDGGNCGSIQSKDNMLKGVQAVGSLGLLCYLVFVVSSSLTFFKDESWKRMKIMKNVNFIAALLTGTLISVAHLVMLQSKVSQNSSLRYSGILGVISAFIALILCPIYIKDSRRTKSDKEKLQSDPEFPKNVPPTSYRMKDSDKERIWQPRNSSSSPDVVIDDYELVMSDTAPKIVVPGKNNMVFEREETLVEIDFDQDEGGEKILTVKNNPSPLYMNSVFNLGVDNDLFPGTGRYNQPVTPFPDDSFRQQHDSTPEAFVYHEPEEPLDRDATQTPVSTFTYDSEDEENGDSRGDVCNKDSFDEELDQNYDTFSKTNNHSVRNVRFEDEGGVEDDDDLLDLFSIGSFANQQMDERQEEYTPSALPIAMTKQLY